MAVPEILILSTPEDVHFCAVDWGLRQAGIHTALLYGNCFPNCERQSLHIDETRMRYEARDALGNAIDVLAAETVWYHRATWPVVSSNVALEDRKAAKDEAEMFIRGVRTLASCQQRWVNAPEMNTAAGRKPYQLFMAKQMGLIIPRTLMSNDPDEIKAFFDAAGGEVLYKPFTGLRWLSDDGVASLYASKIGFNDIEDWNALKLTSHMFQEYVDKRFELRIAYMGGDIVACKLHSQDDERAKIDWRMLNTKDLRPQLYDLPYEVGSALRRYMQAMRLEFGAIDMIVDKNGNHVFLECNPGGQFLFVEEWNSDVCVLSAFLMFLTKNLALSKAQQDKLRALRLQDFFESGELNGHYADLVKKYPVEYRPDVVSYEGRMLQEKEAQAAV